MLKEVVFPPHRRFKSRTEWEPIGFFSDCLCNSTHFDLMLGFFSSSAINVLADGFATFLYNGGQMRLIINDILTDQDKQAIANGEQNSPIPFFDLSDIEKLKQTLSERDAHFFDCLAWLIRNNRLEIKIVIPKEGVGISHTKTGVFSDGLNKVGFDGSCNFSRSALIDNIESLTVSCDWDGETSAATIEEIANEFDCVFRGNDENVVFVPADKVRVHIADSFKQKELKELLEAEYRFIQQDISNNSLPRTVLKALDRAKNKVVSEIEKLKNKDEEISTTDSDEPRFPYESGPRDYQKQAFENWKNNGQKGLFAMATGTGKTITALNCLLEIYKHNGYYKAIILVPTVTLVEQWEEECRKFNFRNIVKVCSKNNNWKQEIDSIKLQEEISSPSDTPSYVIIATYSSFSREIPFNVLTNWDANKRVYARLLFISDEAHNMGAKRILDRIGGICYARRIGLSATPSRQFDDEGNKTISEFFGCKKEYTFVYDMRKAIENNALCRYYYYPHIVNLTDNELSEYIKISKKLAPYYNYDKKTFPQADEILMGLLLKRKRIIHKAENKKEIFRNILQDRFKEKGNLKYTLVYVPEGNRPDANESDYFDSSDYLLEDEETTHLIDDYTRIIQQISESTTVRKFVSDTSERNQILADFAEGKLEVLTSMKCLDEGVDVPRSEMAIFCASTGNPRQFIQRRGRILRKHPDKPFAIIHDLVVAPVINSTYSSYNMERALLESEIKRVRDFATLSENADVAYAELENVLSYYNISLF